MSRGVKGVKAKWLEARARGDRTFDPGAPCVHGHVSLRWTNNGICIECKRARDNAYNAAHPEEHLARARASAARRPDEIRAYRKAYYAAHADEAKTRTREWELANPERSRAAKRAWDRKNAERLRHTARERRAANPEPYRAMHRAWKRRNKHKVKEQEHRRRARELGARLGCRKEYAAFVKWARSARAVPCYWCGKRTKKSARHIDHIIPLARGGADAIENLCVACAPCNVTKNAHMPYEFAGQAEIAF